MTKLRSTQRTVVGEQEARRRVFRSVWDTERQTAAGRSWSPSSCSYSCHDSHSHCYTPTPTKSSLPGLVYQQHRGIPVGQRSRRSSQLNLTGSTAHFGSDGMSDVNMPLTLSGASGESSHQPFWCIIFSLKWRLCWLYRQHHREEL